VLEQVGTFTMKGYTEYLKALKGYLDKEVFNEFIQKYIETFSNEDNNTK